MDFNGSPPNSYYLTVPHFLLPHFRLPFSLLLPLPSTRQHPSYGDCLEVKRENYQNSSVLDCVIQCSHTVHSTFM